MGAVKKKKKAKHWWSWRFRLFRLTLVLWVIVIGLLASQYALMMFFASENFWYFEYSQTICFSSFLAAFFLSYFTPIFWIWKTNQFWMPQIIKANVLVLLMFGVIFMLLVLIMIGAAWSQPTSSVILDHPHLSYPATFHTDRYFYRLTYLRSSSGPNSMRVSQCDPVHGCTDVCRYLLKTGISPYQFDLFANAKTQTVSLRLDEEPVCTAFE